MIRGSLLPPLLLVDCKSLQDFCVGENLIFQFAPLFRQAATFIKHPGFITKLNPVWEKSPNSHLSVVQFHFLGRWARAGRKFPITVEGIDDQRKWQGRLHDILIVHFEDFGNHFILTARDRASTIVRRRFENEHEAFSDAEASQRG
jgi:hypothetical protein